MSETHDCTIAAPPATSLDTRVIEFRLYVYSQEAREKQRLYDPVELQLIADDLLRKVLDNDRKHDPRATSVREMLALLSPDEAAWPSLIAASLQTLVILSPEERAAFDSQVAEMKRTDVA